MPKRKRIRKVVRVKGGVKRVAVKTTTKKKVKPPTVRAVENGQKKVVRSAAIRSAEVVIVEDRVINMMLGDVRYLEAIPCLKSGKQSLKNVGRKCGRCTKTRTTMRNRAMNNIRRCLANLKGEQQSMLKKLLNTKKVQVPTKAGTISF